MPLGFCENQVDRGAIKAWEVGRHDRNPIARPCGTGTVDARRVQSWAFLAYPAGLKGLGHPMNLGIIADDDDLVHRGRRRDSRKNVGEESDGEVRAGWVRRRHQPRLCVREPLHRDDR